MGNVKSLGVALFLILAMSTVAVAQENAVSAPASMQPGVAALSSDAVYQACRQKRLDSMHEQQDANSESRSDNDTDGDSLLAEANCAYGLRDYRAMTILGVMTNAAYNARHPKHPMSDYEDGTFNLRLATAFYRLGNAAQATKYAKLSYSVIPALYRGICFVDATCHGDRILLIKVDPTAKKRFALEDRLEDIRATKKWKHEMAGVSEDMQNVMLNEPGDPCHKQVYDHGPDYHEVTWWYCDANGHYRIAYTFLNGVLESTFKP